MSAAKFIFKVASIVLAGAAIICLILAHLDQITECMYGVREQVAMRRRARFCDCDDMEDYEDWDS